jgi:hypothetical protein
MLWSTTDCLCVYDVELSMEAQCWNYNPGRCGEVMDRTQGKTAGNLNEEYSSYKSIQSVVGGIE